MADFPARGQQAPAFWDLQLKAYIDGADTDAQSTADDALATADAAKAEQDMGRLSEEELSATFAGVSEAGTFPVLDSYNEFFGSTKIFVTGQATTPTTASAGVSAGATVIPVASATGLLAGTVLVVNRATANQQLVSVVSVAGSDVTVTPALAGAVASGSAVSPLWLNATHLTAHGYDAMAYWMVRHVNFPDMAGKKVTLLGNSWFDSITAWANQIVARFPTATVVNKGVSGNTSALMLARFAADVPADSDYVIMNEPGVNDTINWGLQFVMGNAGSLVAATRNIGAKPIFLTCPPLAGLTHKATALAVRVKAAGENDAAKVADPAFGNNNHASGLNALAHVTTGGLNVAIGENALNALTTPNATTGVGYGAGRVITTGGDNTLLGYLAGGALTTGVGNTHLGRSSGSGASTAGNQTLVGFSATGGNNANATAIGSSANVAAFLGTALGYGTVVGSGHDRSVAIGSASSTSAAEQVALGARHIEIKEHAAGDPAAPATDFARLYTKDVAGKTGLFVRFSTGAVQQIALEP